MDKELLDYFKGDELAASTWKNKYAAKGEVTPDDTHRRMAKEFARIERNYTPLIFNRNKNIGDLSSYGRNRKPLTEEAVYELFKDFKYIIPGGSVMAGLGTNELVSLSNCFVIDSPKDSYSSIMEVRSQQAQLMKRRGGVGYDLSNLRPRGAKVDNAAKTSTGAASFMEVCSAVTNEVAQNGRRGALMLSMSINHPDIEEFITKKQDLTKVTGANISVKVTDEFMKAVEEDKDYILRWPVDFNLDPAFTDLPYNELVKLGEAFTAGKRVYLKKIRAKELWKTLMHCAWNTAEPGIIFEDTMHNYAPDGVYDRYKMIGTNPCGEIPMGAFDSCRLIHINLTSFVKNPFTDKAFFDYDKLYEVSYETMRLADDLVDLEVESIDRILDKVKDENSIEFNLWSRMKKTALRGRRTGIGFTGLADTLAMLGKKYSSDDSLLAISFIMMMFMRGQLDSTIDMAIERGAFPDWDKTKEVDEEGKGRNTWYEFIRTSFAPNWEPMLKWGRRNISFSTVAPTGTVSLMARCSSGIEPVFLPYYKRRRKCMSPEDRVDYVDKVGEKYTEFYVIHPKLIDWYIKKSDCENCPEVAIDALNRATEEDMRKIFEISPYYGSTAPEIDWKDRVKLQGLIQKFITHSISSTINLPNETTEEEIAGIYLKAWKAGNKGQTIYRDGCREGILNKVEKPKVIEGCQAPKRPKELEADYYEVKVKGEQFIVLVGLLDDKPYEVFALKPKRPVNIGNHKGKITKIRKMHYRFDSEYIQLADLQLANDNIEERAATLYSSMLLRHGVDIEYIIKTAKKVDDNITSFSSAMCRVLSKYIRNQEVKGETCPQCGNKLTREGGCIICKSCGYSRCD